MNTDPKVTRPRLVAVNRQQMVMRAMDVERLIEEDHPARAIWELVGRLDLSWYYAAIAAVEGRAGRDHTDPQVLISLWLYAYSRGISSAREVARDANMNRRFSGCARWRRSATARFRGSVPITRRRWKICSCRCWGC